MAKTSLMFYAHLALCILTLPLHTAQQELISVPLDACDPLERIDWLQIPAELLQNAPVAPSFNRLKRKLVQEKPLIPDDLDWRMPCPESDLHPLAIPARPLAPISVLPAIIVSAPIAQQKPSLHSSSRSKRSKKRQDLPDGPHVCDLCPRGASSTYSYTRSLKKHQRDAHGIDLPGHSYEIIQPRSTQEQEHNKQLLLLCGPFVCQQKPCLQIPYKRASDLLNHEYNKHEQHISATYGYLLQDGSTSIERRNPVVIASLLAKKSKSKKTMMSPKLN